MDSSLFSDSFSSEYLIFVKVPVSSAGKGQLCYTGFRWIFAGNRAAFPALLRAALMAGTSQPMTVNER